MKLGNTLKNVDPTYLDVLQKPGDYVAPQQVSPYVMCYSCGYSQLISNLRIEILE